LGSFSVNYSSMRAKEEHGLDQTIIAFFSAVFEGCCIHVFGPWRNSHHKTPSQLPNVLLSRWMIPRIDPLSGSCTDGFTTQYKSSSCRQIDYASLPESYAKWWSGHQCQRYSSTDEHSRQGQSNVVYPPKAQRRRRLDPDQISHVLSHLRAIGRKSLFRTDY